MSGRFQKLPPERRAALVEAITAEVAERGFAGASVAGIAQRAGTSKASLFYYFADRDEMLAAAVGAFFEEALGAGEAPSALSAAATADEFWAAFGALYRGVAARLGADPVRARFARAWIELMSRGEAPAPLDPLLSRARSIFDLVVSAGIACGGVRSDLPAPLLARGIFALALAADGWMAEAVLHGAPVDGAVTAVLALFRSAFGGGDRTRAFEDSAPRSRDPQVLNPVSGPASLRGHVHPKEPAAVRHAEAKAAQPGRGAGGDPPRGRASPAGGRSRARRAQGHR